MALRRLAPIAASMLATALLAASLFVAVPVAAGGNAGAQSSEAVRLINGARAAKGKSALRVDPYLADKAANGPIPCPDDATSTITGRTADFAATGQMSHYLRLCNAATYTESKVLFITTMQKWGYTSDGEILTFNRGYGTGKYLFSYGSFVSWTYSTAGRAVVGWLKSSGHRNIILGSYDRIGCGVWQSGSTYWYACEFSRGGPSPDGLQAPPTKSPFPDPVPTGTPKPAASPGSSSGSGSGSNATARPAATPTASASPTGSPTPLPTEGMPLPSASGDLAVIGATAGGSEFDLGAAGLDDKGPSNGGATYYMMLGVLIAFALAGAGLGGLILLSQRPPLAASQGQQGYAGDDGDEAAKLP